MATNESELVVNFRGAPARPILVDGDPRLLVRAAPVDAIPPLREAMFETVFCGIETPDADALKALTLNPAKMLHLDGRLGSLEKGKDADFVILSGPPFSVYTHVLETFIDGKRVFNRAEHVYPNLFAPAGAVSQTVAQYYYRYYAGTNAYLGTSSADNQLYYFGPASGNALFDAGPLSVWQTTAGCP